MTTYLTQTDVCKRYGISRWSIYRWRQDSELGFPQPYNFNGRLRWDADELAAWERSWGKSHLATDCGPHAKAQAA